MWRRELLRFEKTCSTEKPPWSMGICRFILVKAASFRDENWRFWSGLRDLNPRSLGPKPSAIPNFAKPGYEVKNFSEVVKHVVKGYFRPEQGRSQEEKALEPQRVFGLERFCHRFGAPAPKSSALPTGPHPDMKLREFFRSGQTCGQDNTTTFLRNFQEGK